MAEQTHSQIVNFIWSICDLLRGPYKRNEYRKVILPLTVLRRFDCVLEPTKDAVLSAYRKLEDKPENIIKNTLYKITGVPFYNLSKLTFKKLLDDPNQIAANLNSYIQGFSSSVRRIFQHFDFGIQITKMQEKNLLFNVINKFTSAEIDLSPTATDNMKMGEVFEELIRIGAEQANEEAGEHFTPREVIELMVNLLLSPEQDLRKSHVVKTIYDPACGTGGMLSAAEKYIKSLNAEAKPFLYGQDHNDEAFATCRSDMLIKGDETENIKQDCTFQKDGFAGKTFDYMLANPPFGVDWKQQQKYIEKEEESLGYDGRFGAGLPRINDGSLLFLQHMIAKMQPLEKGGSRIAIVFNGSPLFTGDAGSGESNIRQWIIENDWLEAIVALPDQLFYNTGISTYVWVLTNRKEAEREGKIQLIDARQFYVKMRKSRGNKRNQIGDSKENRPDQIGEITGIYGRFGDGESRLLEIDGGQKEVVVSKVFDNTDFGYHKIVVERPLRLNFRASAEGIALLDTHRGFKNLAESKKKNEARRLEDIEAGKLSQERIKALLADLAAATGGRLFKDRAAFKKALRDVEKEAGLRLAAKEVKIVLEVLSERDGSAQICRDSQGKPEADTNLRDTESVPLKESIDDYFKREVLPHVPDAWVDHSKTKVGYEIPLNRHFYRYEPPRPLAVIEADIIGLEREIVAMLAKVTGSSEGLK
jgi:type I restriction enzyme M protein